MRTTTATTSALLTLLTSLTSALPQPQRLTHPDPDLGYTFDHPNNKLFFDSFISVYLDGANWIGDQLNFDNRNYSVYSCYATTGFPTNYNSSSSKAGGGISMNMTQPPITQMEIQWQPNGNNSTKIIDQDNFTGNRTGDWSYVVDQLSKNESLSSRVIMPVYNWQGLPQALNLLTKKGLNGPWNEMTVSWPAYDPINGSYVRSQDTIWYEFSSYSNLTASYLVDPDHSRILRRD